MIATRTAGFASGCSIRERRLRENAQVAYRSCCIVPDIVPPNPNLSVDPPYRFLPSPSLQQQRLHREKSGNSSSKTFPSGEGGTAQAVTDEAISSRLDLPHPVFRVSIKSFPVAGCAMQSPARFRFADAEVCSSLVFQYRNEPPTIRVVLSRGFSPII